MYRSTAEGRFLYVNPALVRMLGYVSAEELIAVDISGAIYADPAQRRPLVARYLEAGAFDGVDVTWRRKDGQLIQVRLYGHAVKGTSAGFDVQVVDITALRNAEGQVRAQRSELQQAVTKLHAVMAQMPVMTWTVDRELRVTSFECTAYPSYDSMLGQTLDKVLPMTDPRAVISHRRALEGHEETFEAEFDDKLWLISVAPMRDADGEVVGVIGSGIDVTMMRRVEKSVQQTQKIESLGVLAGGVAHDFNNLLVAILGNADLALREGIIDPAARQAVDAIRTAARRASELTHQLLAYSGRGQLSMSEVDLGPLIIEMVSLLAPRRTGVAHVDVAEELPPVRADAAQVRQVVMNLVTNAFDALPGGGGEVRVKARLVDVEAEPRPQPSDAVTPPAGRYVSIEVTDEGSGMDISMRRKIFDPFFTTKPMGHGLGLAVVLGIVRGHRG
ncbi:MAG: ATP-binding protein, partial [Myxococcota bacterium]